MKKKIFTSVSAFMVIVSLISGMNVYAYSADTDNALGGYSYDYEAGDIDWSLWEDFLKYDLRITDYDSLPENKKNLCQFIYKTEISSDEDIVCERARRMVMGYDVGKRLTVWDCNKYERIADYAWDYNRFYVNGDDYSYAYMGKFTMHCVPDIKHIGKKNYNEYWLDDEGTERIEAIGECTGFVPDNFMDSCTYIRSNGAKEDIKFPEDYSYRTLRFKGLEFVVYPDNTLCLKGIVNGSTLKTYRGQLTIPETVQGITVTRIGSESFSDVEFTQIDIPETVKYIEPIAFKNCPYLEKVNFPSGLASVGTYAFVECPSLKDLSISCPALKSNGNIFYNCSIEKLMINIKAVPFYPSTSKIGKIIFGNNVTEVDTEYLVHKYSIPSKIKIISGTYIPVESDVTVPKNIEIFGAYPDIKPAFFGSGIDSPPEIPLIDEEYCAVDSGYTISGYTGSEAEKYASEHGLKFKSAAQTTTTKKTTKKKTTTTTTATTKKKKR